MKHNFSKKYQNIIDLTLKREIRTYSDDSDIPMQLDRKQTKKFVKTPDDFVGLFCEDY